MLCIFDFHDIYAVLIRIRFNPQYELNFEVTQSVLKVLKNYKHICDINQIRTTLSEIPSLDKEVYGFAFVENKYTYNSFIKNENVYLLLIECFEELLFVLGEKNYERAECLADCLHNLPIIIAEQRSIPKSFIKNEIKAYRLKWNNDFLADAKKYIRE